MDQLKDCFLKKPYFLELITSFLQNPEDTSIPISSMSTNAILNLLAPPVNHDFTLTEPISQTNAAKKHLDHQNNRLSNYLSSPTTSAPRRGRPKRVHSMNEVGPFSVPRTAGQTKNLRDLVYLFGELQEENVLAALDIMKTRAKILADFSQIVTDVELDSLVGIGRNPAKKHTLENAVDQLFINNRFNYLINNSKKL